MIKQNDSIKAIGASVILYGFEIILKNNIDINRIGDQNDLTSFDLRFNHNRNYYSRLESTGIDSSSFKQGVIQQVNSKATNVEQKLSNHCIQNKIAEELKKLIIDGSSSIKNQEKNNIMNGNKTELSKNENKLSKSLCQNVSRHNLMTIPKLDVNLDVNLHSFVSQYETRKEGTLTKSSVICKKAIKALNQKFKKKEDRKNGIIVSNLQRAISDNIESTNQQKWKTRASNWFSAESKFIFASVKESECEKWINILTNILQKIN